MSGVHRVVWCHYPIGEHEKQGEGKDSREISICRDILYAGPRGLLGVLPPLPPVVAPASGG